MRRLNFLDDAKSNLADISDQIEASSGSAQTAQAFVARIIAQCERLATLPGTLGRSRSELMPEMRSFPLGRYVIFFRYIGEQVDIVNVLRGARDLDAFFKASQDGDT